MAQTRFLKKNKGAAALEQQHSDLTSGHISKNAIWWAEVSYINLALHFTVTFLLFTPAAMFCDLLPL